MSWEPSRRSLQNPCAGSSRRRNLVAGPVAVRRPRRGVVAPRAVLFMYGEHDQANVRELTRLLRARG